MKNSRQNVLQNCLFLSIKTFHFFPFLFLLRIDSLERVEIWPPKEMTNKRTKENDGWESDNQVNRQKEKKRYERMGNGGSLGLVVMGGDSCSKGRGFESQHRILDGHFSHLFVVKIVMFVWKDENKRKEVGIGPFFKKKNGESVDNLINSDTLLPSIGTRGKVAIQSHHFFVERKKVELLV